MSETDAERLETLRPNPVWDEASYEDAVDTLATHADDLVVKVWGGDWCKDCRSQLPDFGAALEAAGIPEERIEHYPVEKEDDGSKVGPKVEEYSIELIPTVVLEIDGDEVDSPDASGPRECGESTSEVARFVEEENVPIVVYLADQLE